MQLWIPVSTGMTDNGAAGRCRGLGRPQISLGFPPQDWGARGLRMPFEAMLAGFASLYPPYLLPAAMKLRRRVSDPDSH